MPFGGGRIIGEAEDCSDGGNWLWVERGLGKGAV